MSTGTGITMRSINRLGFLHNTDYAPKTDLLMSLSEWLNSETELMRQEAHWDQCLSLFAEFEDL